MIPLKKVRQAIVEDAPIQSRRKRNPRRAVLVTYDRDGRVNVRIEVKLQMRQAV